MKKDWSEMPLGDVLSPVARFEDRDDLKTYQFAGTYSYARGIFRNELKVGSSFNLPSIQRIEAGDFIYCKIMAWEGAFGLAGEDVDDCWMSGAFVAFRPVTQKVLPKFLHYWFKAERNWRRVAASSTGTNVRRKSLHPDDFLKVRIPLPPLAEQQRIVAHLDAIESRLTRAQNLRVEAAKEAEAFTTSLHLAAAKGRMVRLGQLMQLDEKQESITAEGSYPQIGIRSFGMGLFKKPPVLGANTTYRAFNVLSSGQFVMSQVKGWEGAVGVADEDYEGWFASPEYRTFSCIEDECDWKYLAHIASTAWFRRQLLAATKGIGARRERVRPEMLLGLEMPFPVVTRQTEAVSLLEKQVAGKQLSSISAVREASLLPSLLDRLFNS